MSDQNKQAMQRFYDEVINRGNLDLIDEMLTIDIVRFRDDGLATDHWGVTDALSMLQQLGVVPAPEGAPAA